MNKRKNSQVPSPPLFFKIKTFLFYRIFRPRRDLKPRIDLGFVIGDLALVENHAHIIEKYLNSQGTLNFKNYYFDAKIRNEVEKCKNVWNHCETKNFTFREITELCECLCLK